MIVTTPLSMDIGTLSMDIRTTPLSMEIIIKIGISSIISRDP